MTGTLSHSLSDLKQLLHSSNAVVVLTGAGASAESGIPTFRGEGAYWRGYAIEDIAMMSKFKEDPSLVWELYHFRREIVLPKVPNRAHHALTELQRTFLEQGKSFKILTQNIDQLHTRAGSRDVIELHGSLFRTECVECGDISENYRSPICPALDGKGSPEKDTPNANIPPELLPRCEKSPCSGILRPHIVWFDEDPTDDHMKTSYEWLDGCDIFLVIGTSSIVPPANEFGPYVAKRGVPVAEFNLEHTPATQGYRFHISGPCGTTLSALI